jgi:hypothetical protein
MLNREQILARKPARQVVLVPEWGGSVTIQALTAGAAFAMTADHSLADLIIASTINEDGTPLFSPEDREALNRLEFSALRKIGDAVIAFNGLSAVAVQEMTKNSPPGLSVDSSSA